MKPLTKGFPGKPQPKRINLLKRGNYMKGAKGWIHTTLIWHQPSRPRWLLPTDTINRGRNVFPSVIPTPRKRAKSPLLRAPHCLDFPSEWPPSFITSPLIRKNKECIYTRNKDSRTWEICMVNQISMICDKYVCFVKQCISHSSW